jgi:hypothetical protein
LLEPEQAVAVAVILAGRALFGQGRMQIAAPFPGWAGFAIGQSIWWASLRSHLRHLSTVGETRRRIRDDYVECARYYLQAREGTLPADPDPVP